jgi:hypothetical protein
MEAGSGWLLLTLAILSFVLSAIGAAVGLILGHLRLPLLITYLGSPASGATTNLIISGVGALAGAWRHARDGRVALHAFLLMGIPSGIGALIAVVVFTQVNPLWSYLIIGIMLVWSGVQLVRRKVEPLPCPPIPLARRIMVEIVVGLGLGALAAVTGLMLGTLRLPIMIRYLRMDPKEAVGTNMAVGCLTALVGALTGLCAGVTTLHWPVLWAVVPPTIVGGYLGGWLTGRLTKEGVQRLVGWVVAFSGVILLIQGSVSGYRQGTSQIPAVWVDEHDLQYDGWFDFDLEEDDEPPDQDPWTPILLRKTNSEG